MTKTTTTIREQNESLVRQYQIDAKLKFPTSTANLFSIAGVLGYLIDRPWLNSGFSRGFVTKPPKDGHNLVWSFDAVLYVLDVLEDKRRWAPMHPRHLSKLSEDEFTQQKQDLTVITSKMQVWAGLSVQELVRALVDEDCRHSRLAVASIMVSRFTGGLDIGGT